MPFLHPHILQQQQAEVRFSAFESNLLLLCGFDQHSSLQMLVFFVYADQARAVHEILLVHLHQLSEMCL